MQLQDQSTSQRGALGKFASRALKAARGRAAQGSSSTGATAAVNAINIDMMAREGATARRGRQVDAIIEGEVQSRARWEQQGFGGSKAYSARC